jgi:hypothetical protein
MQPTNDRTVRLLPLVQSGSTGAQFRPHALFPVELPYRSIRLYTYVDEVALQVDWELASYKIYPDIVALAHERITGQSGGSIFNSKRIRPAPSGASRENARHKIRGALKSNREIREFC